MIKQYPHTSQVTTIPGSTQDANGDFVPTPGAGTLIIEPCRAESSDGNGYLTDQGGKKIDFSWVVYYPLSTADKAIGSAIRIMNGSDVILNDTIKRFSRGQLNCRVWL